MVYLQLLQTFSVSASSSFNYVTTNGGAEAAEDRDINTQVDVSISAASTLDNGMSVTAFIGLDEASAGQSADGDDAGMTISGDFGSLALGGAASATLGAMATDVTADEAGTSMQTTSTRQTSTSPIWTCLFLCLQSVASA